MGIGYVVGLEVEWYLLRVAQDALSDENIGAPGLRGQPLRTYPPEPGYSYHSESNMDLMQPVLTALAGELDKTHPGAAASLREGLAETLTVLRLGVPPTLARTLRSTNAVESVISICRTHARNVKRWRDGQMALRWCAAGMAEASKQFRRVNGHLHLAALRRALDEHVAAHTGEAVRQHEPVIAA